MSSGRLWILARAVAAILLTMGATEIAYADVVVGMDLPIVDRLSLDQQDKLLQELHAARVPVIRTWVANDQSYEFIRKAYALGMKVELTVPIQFRDDAQKRAPVADLPHMYSNPPLSAADPEKTGALFEQQIGKLEAMGLQFVAIEVGNEQNNAGFNGEFAVHDAGGAKNMSLYDLKHDPEGQRIAAGLRNYVRVLAAVKQVRDRSRLNRGTPVLLGGLADNGAEKAWPDARASGVSINAAIDFMRENGLDQVVDAYGIHTYPWINGPGEPGPMESRRRRLADFALSECRPAGRGKPCWITEWGVKNPDQSCPSDEGARTVLVREFMANVRPYVDERRVLGLIYYLWEGPPNAQHPDPLSVFRCGALTQPGRLAIDADLLR